MAKKKGDKTVHIILAIFLLAIALLHATRIFLNLTFTLGSWQVPIWLSWIAVIVIVIFSIILLRTAKN